MFKRKSLYLAVLAGFSAFTVTVWAAGDIDKPYSDPVMYSMKQEASLPREEANEGTAVAHRTLELTNGKTLNYTATTGHLVTDGKKAASMFYVAYTAKNVTGSPRPVTFVFNGGGHDFQAQGPAAILHMTGWGPVRMEEKNTGSDAEPNHELRPAADSLLNKTDLVFIDPPGAGYSQAIAPAVNSDFYALEGDSKVFRDFITRYLKLNQREKSPAFLYGESAGGPRAIHLAKKLADTGIFLEGIILNSPATGRYRSCEWQGEDGDSDSNPSMVYSCASAVPTMAALSHYYGLVAQSENRTSYVNKVINFVRDEYLPQELAAIKNGTHQLPDATMEKLVRYIGFSREQLGDFPYFSKINADGSVNSGLFGNTRLAYIKALGLEQECHGVGPYPAICPSNNVYDARRMRDQPYGNDVALKNLYPQTEEYMDRQLGYTAGVRYSCSAYAENCNKSAPNLREYDPIIPPDGEGFSSWQRDVVPALAQGMKANANLRVLVISGYDDDQTQTGSMALAFSEPDLDARRIRFAGFAGGHMTYWDKNSRPLIKEALNAFYDNKQAAITTVTANGYAFPVENKFPTTGFKGAQFTLGLSHANPSDFNWTSNLD